MTGTISRKWEVSRANLALDVNLVQGKLGGCGHGNEAPWRILGSGYNLNSIGKVFFAVPKTTLGIGTVMA